MMRMAFLSTILNVPTERFPKIKRGRREASLPASFFCIFQPHFPDASKFDEDCKSPIYVIKYLYT